MFLKLLQSPHVLLTFGKVPNPLPLPHKTPSERPKVVRACGAFTIFTSKCALRHNGVHFFDIATSKSAPRMVLCTFWLRTTAGTFSTSQLLNVPSWGALDILTSERASRHNGLQFFISQLATWLCTRCFNEPTFRPSGATNHWKTPWIALFYLFAHLHLLSSDCFSSLIFFLLLFSSLTLPTSAFFHLYILSEVWLLNFLR